MKIRAEMLCKRYAPNNALDGVSLTIEPGQIVAVLGANGAGKTTLLNALAGVIPLDGGKVFFDDQLYGLDCEALRRRFMLLPDIPPVPGHWSPLRFIGTTLKLYERPLEGIETQVEALLEKLDLLSVAGWPLNRLSRGQSYKAVMAGFIAADPEVWFVDEPFSSGMDPRGLNCFKEYAREAAGRGHTIVYTTQIIEVAEQFSHRICVMEKGKLKAYEDSANLGGATALTSLLTQLREQAPS